MKDTFKSLQIPTFMNWKDALKMMMGAMLPALTSLMVMVVLGTILNWLFLLIMGYRIMDTLFAPTNSFMQLLPTLLVVLLFLIGFPIIYFLIGKSYAIKSTLKAIYKKNAPALFDYLVPQVVATVGNLQNNTTVIKAKDLSSNFVSKIQGMPWLIKLLYQQLLNKIPFGETLEKITSITALTEENYPSISAQLNEQLSSYIEKEFLDVSFKNFFLLLLVNIVVMVVCVVFVL